MRLGMWGPVAVQVLWELRDHGQDFDCLLGEVGTIVGLEQRIDRVFLYHKTCQLPS